MLGYVDYAITIGGFLSARIPGMHALTALVILLAGLALTFTFPHTLKGVLTSTFLILLIASISEWSWNIVYSWISESLLMAALWTLFGAVIAANFFLWRLLKWFNPFTATVTMLLTGVYLYFWAVTGFHTTIAYDIQTRSWYVSKYFSDIGTNLLEIVQHTLTVGGLSLSVMLRNRK